MNIYDANLWFRVPEHEQFDSKKAYRAVAISDYSESATAQVFLVTDNGYLWGVPQNKCICVSKLWRSATKQELAMALPTVAPRSDFD